MNTRSYRPLTVEEVSVLRANGCTIDPWSRVEVAEGFSADRIRNCSFRGYVRIGSDVEIDTVHGGIEGYVIEDDVVIRDVGQLISTGKSSFGNGLRIAVLNEAGGREVPVFDRLSAQTAYVAAMYRHRQDTVRGIEKIADNYAALVRKEGAIVSEGAVITRCGSITDVRIGECAVIDGASELVNGTVLSSADAPTMIGRGVIVRDFIVSEASEITDHAIVSRCFVGQACRIGKGFCAENSLFFSNSECFNGEACSIFAGPYTVTHHKSTLLIGGMFSFFNAGSNTNQSNHMYRLGPVHQGILERGAKTTSNSYILFPARVGAFTLVKGRHYNNPDTIEFPYSYLLESEGESVLVPAANLRNCGMIRDTLKWPSRDRRMGSKTDRIRFEPCSPRIVERMNAAVALLEGITEESKPYTVHKNVRIPSSSVDQAVALYSLAVAVYTGRKLVEKLNDPETDSTHLAALFDNEGSRDWRDISGLPAPGNVVEALLDRIDSGEIDTPEALLTGWKKIDNCYSLYEWEYVAGLILRGLSCSAEELTADRLCGLIEEYMFGIEQMTGWAIADAEKEYGARMRIGYGIDGDEPVACADFIAVHGTVEDNPFVRQLIDSHEGELSEARRALEKLTVPA